MCGIAGFIAATGADSMRKIGERMASAIAYRGPDDSGVWVDAVAGICLAHRRLSIIELSSAGHQPMLSESGRFILDFNGEIYNHLEVRSELKAVDILAKVDRAAMSVSLKAECPIWTIASSSSLGACHCT